MDLYNDELLSSLSDAERAVALDILKEYSNTGTSPTYDELRFKDYNEIPVDIEEFLHNTEYLGGSLVNEDGKFTVYPYWVNTLKKVFPDNIQTDYHTLALTGSIGIGKSFVGVICGVYLLYRMMCLKDPYIHYGLQPIDKITFAFLNITLDAAESVAWQKCQELLKNSPWFCARGIITGTSKQVWNPPEGIDLITGSQPRHIIGRAIFFCLDGETVVLTKEGDKKLSELSGKTIQVATINKDFETEWSVPCTVQPTDVSTTEYQIELEDGSILKCTPTHRFMLTDGSYKEAQYLTEEDEILEYTPVGYVYKTTCTLNNEVYVGQHKKSSFDANYYGSGLIIQRALKKYGKKNFKVEVMGWAKTIGELNDLESKFILESKQCAETKCLNISSGAKGGHENYSHAPRPWVTGLSRKGKVAITDGVKTRYVEADAPVPEGWHNGTSSKGKAKPPWSEKTREIMAGTRAGSRNGNYGKGCFGEKNGRYGKPCSEETRKRISEAKKGKKYSHELYVGRNAGVPKPEGFGEKASRSLTGHVVPEETKKKIALANSGSKGKHWYTDGVHNTCCVVPPEGYRPGKVRVNGGQA